MIQTPTVCGYSIPASAISHGKSNTEKPQPYNSYGNGPGVLSRNIGDYRACQSPTLGCLCVASTNETIQDVTTLLDCIPLKQKGPENIICAFRTGLDLRYGSFGCSLAVGRNILDLIYMQLSPVGTPPGA